MNKSARILSLLLVSLSLLMCARGINVILTEPEENKVLLVGSIFFILDGFRGAQEIYKDGIEIAIAGLYGPKDDPFFEWVKTDTAGFFFLPNAPANGRYEIKGLRFYIKGGGAIVLVKDFRNIIDQYQSTSWDNIRFSGILFSKTPEVPDRRIVNLKHNLFIIRPSGDIEHRTTDIISGYKVPLSFDLNLETPLIFDYFIENEEFENSAWLPFLKECSPNYE